MKQIILGTAGHIDHGKTSLVKAITGVNTDRLKEEKLRGITIELGFASLELPSGQMLGIVDVPGHEKFVKNMVAGASGIDLVCMVIAADEGVMPQTREHMEICSLLGIEHGFVALTKTDLVDEEWLELVEDDVRGFLEGTFLEDAPLIPVSAASGEGVENFLATLDELCALVPERTAAGLFRLPVDRVFSMKGFGTVITGSLVNGTVKVGETIMVYPSGITSKVRGIQVHNQATGQARVGQRTAINFQGLERSSVTRGDVLSNPGALKPGYMFDVHLRYLAGNRKAAKNRQRVRFHTGTIEVMGLLILLESDELAPGGAAVAQIRLDQPVSCVRDDRFVIRSYSPVFTIGGGKILNPIPVKHKRFRPEVIDRLRSLVDSPPEAVVAIHVEEAGYRGVSFADLKLMANLTDKQLDGVLQGLLSRRTIVTVDRDQRIYIHGASFDALKELAGGTLAAYHAANPLKPGMSKEELKSKFPPFMGTKLFSLVLNQLIRDKAVVAEENTVRLASHSVSLGVDMTELRRKALEAYEKGGLMPPTIKDLTAALEVPAGQVRDVLMVLVDEGRIVKTKEALYFHVDAIDDLRARLVAYLKENGEIDTPRFKEMTAASRKFVIPLLEYFDARNVTIRVGDTRKLRGNG